MIIVRNWWYDYNNSNREQNFNSETDEILDEIQLRSYFECTFKRIVRKYNSKFSERLIRFCSTKPILAEWIWDNVEHEQILEILEAPMKGFTSTSKRSFSSLTSYSQMKYNKIANIKHQNDQTELYLIEKYWSLLKEAKRLVEDYQSPFDIYSEWKEIRKKLYNHQKQMKDGFYRNDDPKENELRANLKHSKNGDRIGLYGRYYDSEKIAVAQAALDQYLGEKARNKQRNESKEAVKKAKSNFSFGGIRSSVYKSLVLK